MDLPRATGENVSVINISQNSLFIFSFILSSRVWDHLFSTYAKLSEKVTFLTTRRCAYQGVGNITFSENFVYILHE